MGTEQSKRGTEDLTPEILERRILERQMQYLMKHYEDIFPWEDVMACIDDETEPSKNGITCPVCGMGVKWIHFRSPAWTWEQLCGREGELALCLDCHKQWLFNCEEMN